ncbi:hypothetical protein [Nocardioides donggukensis]|uniref:hypothetical protein n=1 Tax=Nocardioides donggukensis TaxID=2774019 RepID=UPI00191FFE19|nr:hypothetical protein [Nocardioides donggukensis]
MDAVRPPLHRRPSGLRRSVAGAAGRAVAFTLAVAASFAVAVLTQDVLPDVPAPPVRGGIDPTTQLMADLRCSASGLPGDAIPASTLIRTPDGRVRQVSFDRGWSVHLGERPGELVALCRAPLR